MQTERWRDPAERSCNIRIQRQMPTCAERSACSQYCNLEVNYSISITICDPFYSYSFAVWSGDDQAAHLAFSSVLSSMGGSVLFEGCPVDDMDLVWRGRVALMAVDEVLPDTSVKLGTVDEDVVRHWYGVDLNNTLSNKTSRSRNWRMRSHPAGSVFAFTCCLCHWE